MPDIPTLRDYGRSRAVVMGTWDYDFLPPVPAVRNSWNRMTGLLTGSLCCWPESRMVTLGNERDPGNLPDQLITAFEDIRDVALFYFVGHGQIDIDDQLCLGLVASRTAANRRAATSLPFQAVRRALLDSGAVTKIVILDCCFADLANRPASTLAALSDDVLDKTAGTGAYTMAASSAYATAWYETGPLTPQTYFTKYLADIVETGIPGQPAGLRLQTLFAQLRDKLSSDGLPIPHARGVDDARDFVFAHNAAPRQTHHDPVQELERMRRRLADAEAREGALRAEVVQHAGQLERLRHQARHVQSMSADQQTQLRDAIHTAERAIDDTTAAQAAASADHLEAVRAAQDYDTTVPSPDSALLASATAASSPPEASQLDSGHLHIAHRQSAASSSAGTVGIRGAWRPRAAFVGITSLALLATTLFYVITLIAANPGAHPHPASSGHQSPTASEHRNAPPHRSITATVPANTLSDPHSNGVDAVAFSPDGKILAAVDGNGTTYLWSMSTHRLAAKLHDPNNSNGYAAVFSSDGKYLATEGGYSGGGTDLWNVATHKLIAKLGTITSAGGSGMAFSLDGKMLAVADSNGYTYLWDVASRTLVYPYGVYDLTFSELAFSPDGITLVGNGDNGLYLWTAATHAFRLALTGLRFGAYSPDGKTVAVVDRKFGIRMWSVATHRLTASFHDPGNKGNFAAILAIEYRLGVVTLAIGDENGSMYLWDVAAGKLSQTFHDPGTFSLNSAAFSPNGRILAAGDYNGSVYLWRVRQLYS